MRKKSCPPNNQEGLGRLRMSHVRIVLRQIIVLALSGLLYAVAAASSSYAQEPTVACPEGQELDPYEIWSAVRSDDGAKAFLRAEYKKFQTPMDFAVWLSCQDFEVSILNGPSGSTLQSGEQRIFAGFLIAPKNRPALWGGSWIDNFIPKQAHTFNIVIDSKFMIKWITIGMTII